MEFIYGGSATNQKTVLGHPSGLFVLFFTEMWERFSFYGMRVLLVNFLTMAITGVNNPGWGWSAEQAGALFGTYAGLLYITPILGGIIADKITGYKWAVVIGAGIMTLGHAAMALETEATLYIGLTLLVLGTGFFKPNMTSIISEMYTRVPEKKDGAFTIYYMGVNAGAFFGMMLCGYLAETQGWAYGFGLAGIFMLFGTLQFWLASPLFGIIGEVPKKETTVSNTTNKTNYFTTIDKILIAISSVIGLLYLLNDPSSKIANINLLPQVFLGISEHISGATELVLIGLFIFLFLVISRIVRYEKVVRDRMIALIIFALFTVFFWMSFEQGATSLIIFARDYTQRELTGNYAVIFNIINTLLTVIPLLIISWVLWLLYKQTHKIIKISNWILIVSFLAIWAVVGGMLYKEFSADVTTVTVAWFSTLNSFFIIAFASFFSKWWESKYNPTSAQKYGLGLILLGVGFAFLSYGANAIPSDATPGSVKVGMIWLIMAYLFHTLGELCLSPLGLSQVSKLVPAKMIGFMYGMWYLAIAIGNKLAGSLGGQIDAITKAYDLSTFFLIFTLVPIVAGIIITLLNKTLVRKMHGIT
ncbi:POT family proton-dependent oligopeptide transporter [Wenyingzhuangia heitensis]|uniref:POT family proton-dependent oligopeptide transporter n=1 Tax=Wenyingzhuangia heitensis TaxID=1487859 RepID=A0ABX0UCQ0_9FLAO|nr:peptide MFS transporter [Wenyingzhuangia heitensis]NIJ46119.1 POT family proton-dependent oligopeptide transporter [Wenyingzhuangia heitensis]